MVQSTGADAAGLAAASAPGSVLVADDDDASLQVLARAVAAGGYRVHTVTNGDEAVRALDTHAFDLVLSDIDMPGKNGIALLQAARERDLDLPVVLVTGAPRLETAMQAVEHGASHYLTKPVDLSQLRATIERAMQAGRLARARRDVARLEGDAAKQVGDLAGLSTRFDKALAGAFMVYQPIVRWSDRSTHAYEALARSTEPALPVPNALFDAAERLGRVFDIGQHLHAICGRQTGRPAGTLLFVNLHTSDLMDDTLYAPRSPLTTVASDVVLEVTERARLETVHDVPGRVAKLRSLGFRIAIDDLGAGYAGLTSFAALEPNYVKLDRGLIQDLHRSPTKMAVVGAMIRACKDLGIDVIGEGVETPGERDALIELGCDLMQGYLFARPEKPFTTASF